MATQTATAVPSPDSREELGRRRIQAAQPGTPMLSSETSLAPNLALETQAKPALRCFFYCRKSTEDDGRQIASIESQRMELEQRFRGLPDLEIVGVYEEARTAKMPGRPVFAEMLARIEAGEANCIVAWAPDRLARNSVDGGHVIYLLDRGILRDLKFATYTFENNSQGKFMLSIMFGQSKYYSDALSDNVKRGNRTKAAKGWRPNSVPIGYRHDPATKGITVDPVYFPLVRRMFDLMLTGGYSSRQIARLARDDWAVRTPSHWKRGGRALAPSSIHRILTNPFYAGLFTFEGQVREGRHQPMLTHEEAERVRQTLARPNPTRAKRYTFALTGLLRCGSCGRAVTAERKVNRYGTRYTYYHCSKSGLGPRCPEPSVRAEQLEGQIAAWLRSITLGPDVQSRLRDLLEPKGCRATAQANRQSVEQALRDAQSQLTELLGLRLRNLISDEDFVCRRAGLQAETIKLARRLEELALPSDDAVIPPSSDAITFSDYAADWFEHGDPALKRQIVRIACSNPTLSNKILSIEAAKWLATLLKWARCPIVRGRVEDVRILFMSDDELVAAMRSFVRKMVGKDSAA